MTCADGVELILMADPVKIANLFEEATRNQNRSVLGSPLLSALHAHNSVIEGCPSSRDVTYETLDVTEPAVVVCGDRQLGSLLNYHLQTLGISSCYSSVSTQESAYQVFGGGLLVACRSMESKSAFNDELRLISNLNISYVPIDYWASSLLIGPAVLKGIGASYDDCMARGAGNSSEYETYLAGLQIPIWGNFLSGIADNGETVERAARLLATISEGGSLDRVDSSVYDTVWQINLDGAVHVRPVLPCSFSMPSRKPWKAHPTDFVVDQRFGIVKELTRVEHTAYMPKTLHTTQARVTDLSRVAGYVNTVFCQGSSLIPEEASAEARKSMIEDNAHSAIGESVERYCSNLIDLKPVLHGTYNELKLKGYPLLNPVEVVLFSKDQYNEPGFPFVEFGLDLPVGWVEGFYLDDRSPVWVPASLVYVNWHSRQYRNDPHTNFPAFAGVAAGETESQAILSGLSEIIERHATMVWWLNAHPLPHVYLDSLQRGLFDGATEVLRPALINLDNCFQIPVAAGIIHNDRSQLVHIGFSCRSTLEQAALKAWSEALTLQEGAHDLMNPEGVHWKAIRSGLLPGRSYKSWREDRRYLDDFRDDLKDVDDLLVQQEVFLDPRSVARVAPLLDLSPSRDSSDVPSLEDAALDTYLRHVEKRGNRSIVVDVTSPDVASCGLHVMRTILSGTVGNTPAAFPYLGNQVVAREAVELGWREKEIPYSQINRFPMPHA